MATKVNYRVHISILPYEGSTPPIDGKDKEYLIVRHIEDFSVEAGGLFWLIEKMAALVDSLKDSGYVVRPE